MIGKEDYPFDADWRECLEAHLRYVIEVQDTNNERSLHQILLSTGFEEVELQRIRADVVGVDYEAVEAEAVDVYAEPDEFAEDQQAHSLNVAQPVDQIDAVEGDSAAMEYEAAVTAVTEAALETTAEVEYEIESAVAEVAEMSEVAAPDQWSHELGIDEAEQLTGDEFVSEKARATSNGEESSDASSAQAYSQPQSQPPAEPPAQQLSLF